MYKEISIKNNWINILFLIFGITLNLFSNELSITKVDNKTNCNPFSYQTNGDISVVVENNGTAIRSTFDITVFYDSNHDNKYSSADQTIMKKSIPSMHANSTKKIDFLGINIALPFRDAPMHIKVDSSNIIHEINETNNINTTIGAYIIEECKK